MECKGNCLHCTNKCNTEFDDDEIVEDLKKWISMSRYISEPVFVQPILLQRSLDLINRLQAERDCYKNELKYENIEKEALNKLCGEQKAEIERLKAESQMADGYADALVERAKSEAIKEFAEKLKKSIKKSVDDAWHSDGNGIYDAECVLDDIDNLVKEMVGEE